MSVIDISSINGKVANDGVTEQGILSSENWNLLVSAVQEMQNKSVVNITLSATPDSEEIEITLTLETGKDTTAQRKITFPIATALNTIDISDIDLDTERINELATARRNTRFNVVQSNAGTTKWNSGVLDVFSDNMGHLLTEVLTTHYSMENGNLINGHKDDTIYRYWRSYHRIKGGTSDIPVGEWGAWKLLSTSDDREGFINNFSLIGKDVERLQKEDESIKDSIDKLVIGEVPSLSKEEIDGLVRG